MPARRLAVPLAAIAIVLGWAALQTVSWVPAAWHHPLWTMASDVVGAALPGAISVHPAAGWVAILWIATVVAVFFLAVEFGRDPARARAVILCLVGAGTAIAAYGLVVYALGNETILWEPKGAYPTALTATFVNRNSFAAYAGICMVCTLGLLLDGIIEMRRARAKPDLLRATPDPSRAKLETAQRRRRRVTVALLALALPVLAAALILTGSRAGLAVTVLGLVVTASLQFVRLRTGRIAVLLCLVLALIVVAVFGTTLGDLLETRFLHLANDVDGRFTAYGRVVAAIEASPWLGYGLGAFEQAFTMFRTSSEYVHARWNYAHNDWLEALMTLGVPAGAMLWLVFAWMLARCLVGALRRRQGAVYGAIGAGASILTIAHSAVDFSLQMQGFTIALIAMLGVGIGQSWSSREPA